MKGTKPRLATGSITNSPTTTARWQSNCGSITWTTSNPKKSSTRWSPSESSWKSAGNCLISWSRPMATKIKRTRFQEIINNTECSRRSGKGPGRGCGEQGGVRKSDGTQKAQAQKATVTQEQDNLLDQIMSETRIGRDEEQRERSRQQITTLVEEVMKGNCSSRRTWRQRSTPELPISMACSLSN